MFCKSCGEEISFTDKFCKSCGAEQNKQIESNVKNSFINSGNGNQVGNVNNTGKIGEINQYIDINKTQPYDNEKIAKKKLVDIKTLSIGAILTTIATLTTLYLNIKKIFIDGIISTDGQVENLSISLNAMLVLVIISVVLMFLLIELKRKGIIKIQVYFVDITLVNINNKIYKMKIKEVCPKCKTKPKGKLRFYQDINKKFYVKCSKNSDHIFELDHTQF